MNKILQIFLLTGIFVGVSSCYFIEPDLKSIVSTRLKESKLNLIPDKPGITPSYYCIWRTQGNALSHDKQASNFGVTGHSAYAEKLTEELIFGKNGAISKSLSPLAKWDLRLKSSITLANWFFQKQSFPVEW